MGITRRNALYSASILGASFLLNGCEFHCNHEKLIKQILKEKDEIKKSLIHKIYYELPKHVYIAETIAEDEEYVREGCGIILNGRYITMAHIIPEEDVRCRKTMLYGKELEQIILDREDDVAIFNLPYDLNLPDFPAKPSTEIHLGDEIYIIGNPDLTGPNVRPSHISDLDGLNESALFLSQQKTKNCFGISSGVIPGDSGTPVVNSNFELLGLIKLTPFGNYPVLGYVCKIEKYLQHI